MRSLAFVLLAVLTLTACGPRLGRVEGYAFQLIGGRQRPAPGTRIDLYSLAGDGSKRSITCDEAGHYLIADLEPGAYLRIASAAEVYGPPLDALRRLTMTAKELQQLTGYDAISNMPDELKAAIAFRQPPPGPEETETAARLRTAREAHLEETVQSYLASWPDTLKRMLPDVGSSAIDLLSLRVAVRETTMDGILFGQADTLR